MMNLLAAYSAFWWLLSVSLLINAAAFAVVINVIRGRGGVRYLRSVALKDNEATVDRGSRARREMYATLPTPAVRPIVFLGDSITYACEWGEAFQTGVPVLNRGIGGDTSLGVLQRLPDICRLNPAIVFLMIGANDPQMLAYSPEDTFQNCRTIIAQLLQSSPDVQLYVQSVLPSRSPKFNAWSDELNRKLQTLNGDEQQVHYIDLRSSFVNSKQELDERMTYDGLHLSAEGFLVWREAVQPFVKQPARTRVASTESF